MHRHGASFLGSLVLTLGFATVGCGGDDAGGSSSGRTTSQGLCTRDPALLKQAFECTRDDDCPCGASCALGACVAQCQNDSECASGLVCDGYGRCTSELKANQPVLPGVSPQQVGAPADAGAPRDAGTAPTIPLDVGAIRLDRSSIDLRGMDAVATFHVSAAQGTIPNVRLLAAPGLQIDCGTGLTTECMLGVVALGATPREIQVRSTGEFPTTDLPFNVRVFAGTEFKEVGVVKRGAAPTPLSPREGFYEGTASLAGAGMRSRTTVDTLPPELARLKLTVKAKIFPSSGGQYIVSFDDARGAVFPRVAVGTLSVEGGAETWKIDVPSQQFLGEDSDTVALGAIDVHASEQMKGVTFKDGLFLGDVVSTFDGITTAAASPFARWRLSLTRTGDLPAGEVAPAIAARPVADVVARANQPSPKRPSRSRTSRARTCSPAPSCRSQRGARPTPSRSSPSAPRPTTAAI